MPKNLRKKLVTDIYEEEYYKNIAYRFYGQFPGRPVETIIE
jgi:hypothetical protein